MDSFPEPLRPISSAPAFVQEEPALATDPEPDEPACAPIAAAPSATLPPFATPSAPAPPSPIVRLLLGLIVQAAPARDTVTLPAFPALTPISAPVPPADGAALPSFPVPFTSATTSSSPL